MNVPAIAKKTYEELKNHVEFQGIVEFIVQHLMKIPHAYRRARFIHQVVDEYNQEVFGHPLVQQFSPCKMGCSACCHTQVSVTEDEAQLLVHRIDGGVEIDRERLARQMSAQDSSEAFYKLSFEDRKCIFLGENGACRVYEDRPSVCRSNTVIGEADQCDTSTSVKPTRLIKTPKADLVVYASYLHSESGGVLPHMVGKFLK